MKADVILPLAESPFPNGKMLRHRYLTINACWFATNLHRSAVLLRNVRGVR